MFQRSNVGEMKKNRAFINTPTKKSRCGKKNHFNGLKILHLHKKPLVLNQGPEQARFIKGNLMSNVVELKGKRMQGTNLSSGVVFTKCTACSNSK